MLWIGGQNGANLQGYGYPNAPPGGPSNQAPAGAPASLPSTLRSDGWYAGLSVSSRPPLWVVDPLEPQLSRVERRHPHVHHSLFNPPPPPAELVHLRLNLGGQTFFESNKENLPSMPVPPRPAGPVLAS